ncbi:PKS01 highly reducing polyketide synthase [Diaporthe amygdali]|uniref:PKS01 highly reducing polyketide synthase n=1 Tax=Phomopsis amygdali TaxID=1214568 RepID=UPI0022FE736D|nr:PKS01 highly reducing polyketide synthase [Diaporthe amygdali]KAJ0108782.1 PKS01 highly reducing polyketide synthase [Diaporthe amygdali]
MANNNNSPIAITGLACRFPGDGKNLSQFWDSLCNGKSAWTPIPKTRFSPDALSASIPQGGHFLQEDISLFDSNFFRIPRTEARAMDPQQRLMLEVVYEALEAGGYPLEGLAGTATGVYMGQFTSDYKELVCRDAESAIPFSVTGLQTTSLSNRISWLFDLKGPSLTMDTACSSSLVALHLACQSLRAGESQMAIVGGCNLMISPDMFMFEAGQGFLSPDGKCKTFDQSANGYGRGEGFAAVIVKPLDLAIADGDPIRAVIRGTAANQDGKTKGFTQPSSEAQASLISSVYRSAGLKFDGTGYVEAHGTGTQAGDFEETTALAKTIAATCSQGKKLIVGSVKPNIGHLEAAAGLAGVMKSVMMLETGMIPPNLYYNNPNPKIRFDDHHLQVPTAVMPWPNEGLRRISVNSFGYGGSNAHVILDDAYSYLDQHRLRGHHITKFTQLNGTSDTWDKPSSSFCRVFPISSHDKDGLGRVKRALAKYLAVKSNQLRSMRDRSSFLDDLAFTLSDRRSNLQWKAYFIASSLEDLLAALAADNTTLPTRPSSRKPRLGFVFTGQGAQWAGMGMDLMQYRVFRDSIEAADRYLQHELGCTWSACEELKKGKSTSRLRMPQYSQGLCTVLQVGLVELLESWGIRPVAVVGHSSGEIAAAYCQGSISREDAWRVAYFRGVVSSKLKTCGIDGSMMAVGISPEGAGELIQQLAPKKVHLACVNSPASVTLSGDADAIDVVYDALRERGVFVRKLQVDVAYHSPHMQLVARDYWKTIADVSTKFSSGTCNMYSSVTRELVQPGEIVPAYWVRNLVSPVQFATAVQQLVTNEKSLDLLIEVGPHAALQGPSTQSLQNIGITDLPYHSVLLRNQSGVETALNLAGSLSAQGYPVRFQEFNHTKRRTPQPLVDLPAYPWNHSQSHWAETRVAKEYRLRSLPYNSLLGALTPGFVTGERVWTHRIRLSKQTWIQDHKIQGTVFYPAAGFIASAIEAALLSSDASRAAASFRLRNIHLNAALGIDEGEEVEYSVSLRPCLSDTQETSLWNEFNIASCRGDGALVRHCSGLVMVEYDSSIAREMEEQLTLGNGEMTDANLSAVDDDIFYKSLSDVGFHYGPSFQNATDIRAGAGRGYGTIHIPDLGLDMTPRPHVIHPATLDAIFHLIFGALTGSPDGMTQLMVPKTIDEVVIAANIPYQAGTQLKGFSDITSRGFREVIAELIIGDGPANTPAVKISGLCLQEVGGHTESLDAQSARNICSSLFWKPSINFLPYQDQEKVIKEVCAKPRVDLQKTDFAESTEAQASVQTYQALSELIKLLHHCNPSLSISEAFTLSTTRPILSHLPDLVDVLKTANCTIWCADELARQVAEENCHESKDIQIELQNLSQSIPQTGAPLPTTDLIIMNLDSNNSGDLERLVRNAKELLVNDGRLCLIAPDKESEIAKTRLRSFGLSNWFKISDFEDAEGKQQALLLGSKSANLANGHTSPQHDDEIVIIQGAAPSQAAKDLSDQLLKCLTGRGHTAFSVPWDGNTQSWTGKPCISLLEVDRTIMDDPTETDFERIKNLILETTKTLWVSGQSDPSSAIVTGLGRTVRNEEPGLAFHTLQFDLANSQDLNKIADLILRAFIDGSEDNEYMIDNGVIHVSRVLEDDATNDKLHLLDPLHNKTISTAVIGQSDQPLKLSIQNAGMLSSVCFDKDLGTPSTSLEEDELEIVVKSSSVSARDVMTVMGQLPSTDIGFAAAGVVLHSGSAVGQFKPGDRVVVCHSGALCTALTVKADSCVLLPEDVTFDEAAMMPLTHCTAWYALMQRARVQKGQSILIHTAAGGVGEAAIQIAHRVGMEVMATVESDAMRKILRTTYEIPDDNIFDVKDSSCVSGVKRITRGLGADVVLSSVAGEAMRQAGQCLSPWGTFVDISGNNTPDNTSFDMGSFPRNASFTTVDLQRLAKLRPDIMRDVMRDSFEFLRGDDVEKRIAHVPVFPASQVESTFRSVATGQHGNEAVLSFSDEQVVPYLNRHELTLNLDPEAAYVLVGGFGGLGRGIAKMLVDIGARRLCFLSRSGAESTGAQQVSQYLESRGVQVLAQACDIADPESVRDALETCSQQLGRIRGVLQCAMVLRDALFRNMTHREWTESIRPKVQGTWNLHQNLPEVDFFVTLGSFTTIFGNRGQGNYVAGCAFQDAVAHYRRAKGMRAVTIDVGVVRNAGVLAEQGMTNTLRDFEIPYGLDEHELHNIIKMAIAGSESGTVAPQMLTGLATGGSAIAAGVDAWYLSDPKFAIMEKIGAGQATGKAQQQDTSVHAQLSAAKSPAEAATIVLEGLMSRVADVLHTDPSEIDEHRFLHTYGIDSLVSIQIVDWALKSCESRITVLDVMAAVPINESARKIAAKSSLAPKVIEVN